MPVKKIIISKRNQHFYKGKFCCMCGVHILSAHDEGIEIYSKPVGPGNKNMKYYCESCHDDVFGGVRLRNEILSHDPETEAIILQALGVLKDASKIG